MLKLNKLLIFLLVLLIPQNLGLHFIFKESYIFGVLSDYLIPTIYIQDILVTLFILLNFGNLKLKKYDKYIVWFICSFFFSTLYFSSFKVVGSLLLLRVLLYALFSISLRAHIENFTITLVDIFIPLGISVFLVSTLGIFQFILQKSVFDNYLVFGEQPYSITTINISKEVLFDKAVIGSYGTFRHPNTFAGFLAICIYIICKYFPKTIYKIVLLVFAIIAMLFTFSRLAFVALILSFIPFSTALLVFSIALISIYFPYLGSFFDITFASFNKRAELMHAGIVMLKSNLILGDGFLSSLKNDVYLIPQPIHNIFLTILVESGLLGFSLFMFYVKQFFTNRLLVLLFALACFDHYLLTMHQTLLLTFISFALIQSGQLTQHNS